MNKPSDANQGNKLLGNFRGFTPLDESPGPQLPERWWNWGKRCALTGAIVGALVSAAVAVVAALQGDFPTDQLKLLAIPPLCLAFIGWIIGMRWGHAIDRIMRRKDERRLSELERKNEEDLRWEQRLENYRDK